MGRTDFVENRAEVIKNIYTLYSYAINGSEEEEDSLKTMLINQCAYG